MVTLIPHSSKRHESLGSLAHYSIAHDICLKFQTQRLVMMMARQQPNIVVTGTPGVGKTSHCELLAQSTGLKHLSINHIVKDRGCHDGWNKEYRSWMVNEDEVMQDFVRVPARRKVGTDRSQRSSLILSKRSFFKAAVSSTGMLATSFQRAGLILSSCYGQTPTTFTIG